MIDQGARRCFVKIELGGCLFASLNELKAFRLRRLFGLRLNGGKTGRNLQRLAFALGGELFPDSPFLSLPCEPLFHALSGTGVFLGFASRTAGGIVAFGHTPTEAFNLFLQGSRCIDGLRWRDKRARFEIRLLPVGAMEPDAKLTSEFQRRQRICVIASRLMNRPVARLAKRVENVRSFFRNDALIREAAKRLFKSLAFAKIERVMGGNRLAQKLGKLAQLEDRRTGIVAKISLRQRPELHQLGVVNAQEREIDSISPPPKHSLLAIRDCIATPTPPCVSTRCDRNGYLASSTVQRQNFAFAQRPSTKGNLRYSNRASARSPQIRRPERLALLLNLGW